VIDVGNQTLWTAEYELERPLSKMSPILCEELSPDRWHGEIDKSEGRTCQSVWNRSILNSSTQFYPALPPSAQAPNFQHGECLPDGSHEPTSLTFLRRNHDDTEGGDSRLMRWQLRMPHRHKRKYVD
jgi:hypothetical protein